MTNFIHEGHEETQRKQQALRQDYRMDRISCRLFILSILSILSKSRSSCLFVFFVDLKSYRHPIPSWIRPAHQRAAFGMNDDAMPAADSSRPRG
jgi:hypothetical protein